MARVLEETLVLTMCSNNCSYRQWPKEQMTQNEQGMGAPNRVEWDRCQKDKSGRLGADSRAPAEDSQIIAS